MSAVTARLLDAQSASSVQIEADRGLLWLRDAAGSLMPVDVIDIDAHEEGRPYVVHLPDGRVCEVDDGSALQTVLREAGRTDKLVQRGIGFWPATALVLLVLAALLTGLYQWLAPSLYDALANRMSSSWVRGSSAQALAELDASWLQASQLPISKQVALTNAFSALQAPEAGSPPYRLLFRQGGKVGALTLSLPSGDIIVTDQLVALASSDQEVLAALAHELGHLHHRHALQVAVRSAPWATAWAAYSGDMQAGARAVANGLLKRAFPLEYEYAADLYAARMLRVNQMAPSLLASLVLRQETSGEHRRLPGQLGMAPRASERIAHLEALAP